MIARLATAIFIVFSAAPLVLARDAAASDPDRQRLNRYEAAGKELAARARQQLQTLEADARTLGERYAGEVVGKPFYRNADTRSCSQIVALSGAPPLETASMSRPEFDRWFAAQIVDKIDQDRKVIDQELEDFLGRIAAVRTSLDATDERVKSMRLGDEARAREYRDAMSLLMPDNFFSMGFQRVMLDHFRLVTLGFTELGGDTFEQGDGPPGMLCVVEAELSKNNHVLTSTLYELSQVPYQGGEDWVPALKARQAAEQEKCAEAQSAQRDEAAARMRPLRDRLYREREQLRRRMLEWRKEAIGAGPYDAADLVAISRVYGTEVSLDAANIAGMHFTVVSSRYDAGPDYGVHYQRMFIEIDTSCMNWHVYGDYALAGKEGHRWPIQFKYPDLELESPFVLEIRSDAPRVLETILSGAGEDDLGD